jgi:hypothetical protein
VLTIRETRNDFEQSHRVTWSVVISQQLCSSTTNRYTHKQDRHYCPCCVRANITAVSKAVDTVCEHAYHGIPDYVHPQCNGPRGPSNRGSRGTDTVYPEYTVLGCSHLTERERERVQRLGQRTTRPGSISNTPPQ